MARLAFGWEYVRGARQEFRANGFAPQVFPVHIRPSTNEYAAMTTMHPLQEATITSGVELVVTGSVGGGTYRIIVEATEWNGLTLQHAVAEPGQGPGTMQDMDSGAEMGLQSGGMFWVRIVGSDGEAVSPAPRVWIEMDGLYLPDAIGAGPLNTYRLNGDGFWEVISAMDGSMSGGLIRGDLEQEWGNIDRDISVSCYRGYLTTSGDSVCSGALVTAAGPVGFTSRDFAAQNGEFCVEGGAEQEVLVAIGSATRLVWMPSYTGSCTDPSSCYQDTVPLVVGQDACAEVLDPPGGGPTFDPDPIGDDDTGGTGIPEWCQEFIDEYRAVYEGLQSEQCAYACVDAYASCVEADNCADMYGPCHDTLTSCVMGCSM